MLAEPVWGALLGTLVVGWAVGVVGAPPRARAVGLLGLASLNRLASKVVAILFGSAALGAGAGGAADAEADGCAVGAVVGCGAGAVPCPGGRAWAVVLGVPTLAPGKTWAVVVKPACSGGSGVTDGNVGAAGATGAVAAGGAAVAPPEAPVAPGWLPAVSSTAPRGGLPAGTCRRKFCPGRRPRLLRISTSPEEVARRNSVPASPSPSTGTPPAAPVVAPVAAFVPCPWPLGVFVG